MILNFLVIGAVVLILLVLIRRIPMAMEIKHKEESPVTAKEIISVSLTVQANDAFEAKDYRKAEELYIKAASQDPNNVKVYNHLGIIYLEQANYYDAKDAFLQAIKLERDIPSYYVNLGLAYMGLKDYFKACQVFQKALQLEPKNKKYEGLFERAKKFREREQKRGKR